MNFLLLLFESNVQALAWMLLHFIWQGIAVAAVLAGTRVVLKTPRLRYAIACAALFAMAVLPLATLEELRIPALAAAATGGPLLSRVRRLLALDGEDARDGLSCFTVSNLISILVVLAVAAVALEATQAANRVEEEAAERLLAAALEKEREAVAHLEEALRTLERQ